ncbi:hypothetical protein BC332_21530 [Capsicum chinense]|nr:hypothetical protein BC332_21530 [Capsicum chinense]
MTYVLGSVYGLFLLKKVVDGNLLLSLWNPALREVRHLPNPKFEVQPCTTNPPRPFIWQFGLGLDPVTNDYKATPGYRLFKWDLLLASIGGWKCSIVSFDFRSEEFGEIEGPDARYTFHRSHLVMILLDDDSIALMTNVCVCAFKYEIWVMVQPGLWNKLFALKCFTYSQCIKSWFPRAAIYVTERSHLVSVDVRTGETRPLGFRHPGLNKRLME